MAEWPHTPILQDARGNQALQIWANMWAKSEVDLQTRRWFTTVVCTPLNKACGAGAASLDVRPSQPMQHDGLEGKGKKGKGRRKPGKGTNNYSPAPPPPPAEAPARGGKGRGDESSRKCFYCGKPGHVKAECRNKQRVESQQLTWPPWNACAVT